MISEAIVNGGGRWHGQGWLGKGKWNVSHTNVGADGLCLCCGEKLATIDLDPTETEKFAESVASIAIKREKNSSFQKFQVWKHLDVAFLILISYVGLMKWEHNFTCRSG